MARKDTEKSKTRESGQNRVQGFVFGISLEGTEEVVSEGIKAFSQALMKSGLTVSAGTTARPPLLTRGKQSPAPDVDQPPTDGDSTDEQIEESDEPHDTVVLEGKPSNNSNSRRSYNHRPPKFLDELDLTKATKSIEEFMAEKGNPAEANDRYIAIAVWLKEHMSIEEFDINHIYTVFHSLGWKAQVPVSHSQPIRDLKSKRHFLTREKGEGYKVNWKGIQYVAKMGANGQ
ncbi:MAG: hypothetical protein KGO02_24875 [Alphaproteobacteria bacterium]|nr:hypothetical protein [Alphaproteobacteria bacterium]